MRAYAGGDATAFESLYDRHATRVWRYILRSTGNAATADELAQEVWFSVARQAGQYAPRASAPDLPLVRFTTWLFTIARNKIRDHYRKMNRKPQTDLENPEMLSADPDSTPLEELVWVRRLVERLPAHEQELIRLRYAAQLDFVTIAEILGKNAAATRKFHYRLIQKLQKQLEAKYSYEDIIGRSSTMLELFSILPRVAESNSTVLLEGASGTGKELFAKAIHNLSPRKKKRFVGVNCAALPDTLLESELFGYKAGAFTDAKRDKPGRFAMAAGGTIFLDEIADMSPAMQVKLLRVLQERVMEPLGSLEPVKVDTRVIAATNRDLSELVNKGTFREDLYYRICVIHMKLPELKQRREDIPLLVDHMIYKYNRLQNKDIIGVSDEVMAILINYDFPGNIRELENIIEQAFVLCRGGIIELQHLPIELRSSSVSALGKLGSLSLESMEKQCIIEALQRHQGHRKQAALDLGIDVSTLYRKIKALNIEVPETDGRQNNK